MELGVEYTSTTETQYSLRLLASVYNRRIECAADILSRITWIGTKYTQRANRCMYQLFIMRVKNWLRGVGHPRELIGKHIDEETYCKDRWDAGLRAKLLYRAVTGSSLLLGGTEHKITVSKSPCMVFVIQEKNRYE